MPRILVRPRMNPDQILPGSQDINVLLNTGKPPLCSRACVTSETISRNGGPPRATFEQIIAITRFIQRFGTRVN
jgi:hypothetical protein